MFPIINQTQSGTHVDEYSGYIEEGTPLACGVVIWEGVVIVVEALADCAETHEPVLGGVDVAVIGTIPIEVSEAVDEPCEVERADIAERATRKERIERVLIPQ